MKLKNFMFATMIACAFASCSNDDEIPTPGTEPGVEADATLAVRVAGLNVTKSASIPDDKTDASISSLHVYVFNNAGALEVVGAADATQLATNEVLQTSVTAGAKKVIVIANHDKETPTSVADLCGKILTYSAKEYNGNLSMNSQVFDLTIQAGKTNCLGYSDTEVSGKTNAVQAVGTNGTTVTTAAVPLYRNVAKVKLASIVMKTGAGMKYPNATFQLDSVFVLHARKTSTLATVTPWGATTTAGSLNGVSDNWYAAWVAKMLGQEKIKNYMTAGYEAYTGGNLGDVFANKTVTSTAIANVDSFYVYENAVAKASLTAADTTLLVVSGKFLPEGAATVNQDAIETSYYTVAAGIDGITQGGITSLNNASGRTDLGGVLRNMEYQISLTISGPGYETPFGPKQEDKTFLDVKCVVVEFGQVSQNVEI